MRFSKRVVVSVVLAVLVVSGYVVVMRNPGVRIAIVDKITRPEDTATKNGWLVIYPGNFMGDVDADAKRRFSSIENAQVFRIHGKLLPMSQRFEGLGYQPHEVSVFEGQSPKCSQLENKVSLQVTQAQKLDDGLDTMAQVFMQQLIHQQEFQPLHHFFVGFGNQIEEHTVAEHWFKFAGTSVWLERYGVHLMVLRALYSIKGNKRLPNMSLAYAQVFDKHWRELDVDLMVKQQDGTYENMHFPQMLPIPFFHDAKHKTKRFYGPEDARLLLVRNDDGEQEPVLVFNAYHRVMEDNKDKYYRSMFMSWPLQLQHGKGYVDGTPLKDGGRFARTVELRRDDHARLEVQKNWTPFVGEAPDLGGHTHIMFVYRWAPLEILQCSLTHVNELGEAPCTVVHASSDAAAEVGPLRGGTELLRVDAVSSADSETWLGFARAHLFACGCGKDMYRPNLVVIKRNRTQWLLTHLSSYISFDIPIDGWQDASIRCAPRDPSALIPNGISMWLTHANHDYMTMTLSVADNTVHLLHLRDVLKSLVSVNVTSDVVPATNDIITCAIDKSATFCKEYGLHQEAIGTTPNTELVAPT